MSTGHNTAILLAGGSGKRMGAEIPKQYMDICGLPLIARSLHALASSDVIDDIVLVAREGDEEMIRRDIFPLVGKDADKVRAFADGGAERYLSVANGLQAIHWPCSAVFIHDGARPFIDRESLERLDQAVRQYGSAVAGMPVKDTVKITDDFSNVADTPDRAHVWQVQTPQAFSFERIERAYRLLLENLPRLNEEGVRITDDAMVAERFTDQPVHLVQASYHNIKVTTPEDLLIAEAFLNSDLS